jgi:hypothetical protein
MVPTKDLFGNDLGPSFGEQRETRSAPNRLAPTEGPRRLKQRTYAEAAMRGRAKGKISLRRRQLRSGEEGDVRMDCQDRELVRTLAVRLAHLADERVRFNRLLIEHEAQGQPETRGCAS